MTIYSYSVKVIQAVVSHRCTSFSFLRGFKNNITLNMEMSGGTRGNLLSGVAASKEIVQSLQNEVKELAGMVPNFRPGLAIVQVGDREDSNVYIRSKLKSAETIGICAQHVKLPKSTSQIQLAAKIKELNRDPSVHGIIVQMPLDSSYNIDSHAMTDLVSPEKDVDGLNTINEGRVAIGDMGGFVPCTPNGVMELIKRSGIKIVGKNAVVIGRSKIVGTPAAELLKWANATVTVCHSKTQNLPDIVSRADILVVGIGSPNFVKGSWVKDGAVVIDCGINSIPDDTKKCGKRLVGDVHFEEAKEKASYITPVPGGVGPMTVAMLMKNTVLSARRAVNRLVQVNWEFSPLPLHLQDPVPRDIDVAHAHMPKDIADLAQEIGVLSGELIPYGNTKAKLSLSIMDRLKHQKNGHYVVIAGITPTPQGEGKSTTTIGLVQALTAHKRWNSIACVRQPSQGPTFGIKGGAAGGGFSQIIPMEEFNLHLTGDIHAVTAANNLLAAQIEARLFHERTQSQKALYNRLVPVIDNKRTFSKCQKRRLERLGILKDDPDTLSDEEIQKFAVLDIDPSTILWTRVIDTNDRFLRKITIGQSPTEKGFTRETSFSISVASEIMAILALATDLSDLHDRLSQIVVAFSKNGDPVTADDLGATGAMMVLLKDAIQPTLMQTLEGTPVLVHAGPFANIAHGCSSIIADAIAAKLVGPNGFVVTEAGFGSDIGLEKFIGIKCRYSNMTPDAIVIVTTIRALKMHGGCSEPSEYQKVNTNLVNAGLPNLLKHISNGKQFGVPVIVAINHFWSDHPDEIEVVKKASLEAGAFDAVVCKHYALGGEGAIALADAVSNACTQPKNFRQIYDLESPLIEKIEKIAKLMYGAKGVVVSTKVANILADLESQGYGKLPICMSKTALSLSGDPSLKGAPSNFELPLTDAYLSAGAGFIVIMVGEISKMPGLPTRPAIFDIDLNIETGMIEGLF